MAEASPYVLILYYSRHGATAKMAELIANGIESASKLEARLRTVPAVSTDTVASQPPVPEEGAVYCTEDDLRHCKGLALGSPTRFGNMAAAMKHFWDSTGSLWATGALINKPAVTFTSSSSMHGGQESTLLGFYTTVMHWGALIVAPGYTDQSIFAAGGNPYGYSAKAGEFDDAGRAAVTHQAKRLAEYTAKLA